MDVFRVILPVGDVDAATAFWSAVLGGAPGWRVTGGRHYFDCGPTLLACWDPIADGDSAFPGPNPGTIYLATSEALEIVRRRAVGVGAIPDEVRRPGMQTWRKMVTEIRVLSRATRHRTDLLRYLVRRPALLAAVGGYETALLFSSRADNRLKLLAQVKTSSLIGCPF